MAAITRRYPLLSGRATIANHPLFERFTQSAEIEPAPSFGGEIFVPLNDFVGRAVYFFGDLDPKLTWILRRLIKPGDTVADIGANLGVVTAAMAKLAGPQGTVIAFEPNPSLQKFLKRTIAHNKLGNVRLEPVALGNDDSHMTLRVPQGNLGAASLTRTHNGHVDEHQVEVRRLDSMITQPAALMKLDVEGYELDVLRGATKTLSTNRPILILETNDPADAREVTAFLSSFEYEFLSIPRCLLKMKTHRLIDHASAHDMVAIPAERSAELTKLLRTKFMRH